MKILQKIRIGYVLKSADVGTLFSGRNSENSSHTHSLTRAHKPTPAHPLPPTRTRPHLPTPAYTCARRMHTPHMPADADFGLINHMLIGQ